MRIIRMWILSALAVLLFVGVSWSLFVLSFQVVLSSLTRVERPLIAAFRPVHAGYENLSVSLLKPGIPLEPNRLQSIAGRDLDRQLLHQGNLNPASRGLSRAPAAGCIPCSLNVREALFLSPQTDLMLSEASDTSLFVIVFSAIPGPDAILCRP